MCAYFPFSILRAWAWAWVCGVCHGWMLNLCNIHFAFWGIFANVLVSCLYHSNLLSTLLCYAPLSLRFASLQPSRLSFAHFRNGAKNFFQLHLNLMRQLQSYMKSLCWKFWHWSCFESHIRIAKVSSRRDNFYRISDSKCVCVFCMDEFKMDFLTCSHITLGWME